MTSPRQPVVMVTGANSGIGLALVRKLWNSAYRVVATARPQSIAQLQCTPFVDSERFLVRALELTDESQRRAVVDEVHERWGGVDVLINNAGISYRAVMEHMSEDDELLQMGANYFGPLGLIRLVLPAMRARREGRIINISSVSGMMAMPTMGSYSASKFALEGASESLWYELRPFNIKVTLVEPGFINSHSHHHVHLTEAGHSSATGHDDYTVCYQSMSGFVEQLMRRAWATPESVADVILSVIENPNPPLRLPATVDAVFFSYLRRLLPRAIYHRMLYWNLPNIRRWGQK